VASPARVANLRTCTCMGASLKPSTNSSALIERTRELSPESELPMTVSASESTVPRVFAEVWEFVALPGEAQKLQREIPLALRKGNGKADGLLNCMVLFSEQEARLVTVITLWSEQDRLETCEDTSKRLKRILDPYVDRWLRTRTFVSFLASLLPV
jgi:hypothetical protein